MAKPENIADGDATDQGDTASLGLFGRSVGTNGTNGAGGGVAKGRHAGTAQVTASELVRHFGIWQDRAAREPVYVLNRGRARFVLASIDHIDRLAAERGGSEGLEGNDALTALIDATREMILICDKDLRLYAISRAARSYLGTRVRTGIPIRELAIGPTSDFVYEMTVRVINTGMPETAELMAAMRPGRRLHVSVEPHPVGAVIFTRDITDEAELQELAAGKSALYDAMEQLVTVASTHINLRGYVERPRRTLARLTGIAEDALVQLRFVNLVEISTRVAVGEAIENVIRTGKATSVDASLLVARGEPKLVRIGLGAIMRHGSVNGLIAAIAPTTI